MDDCSIRPRLPLACDLSGPEREGRRGELEEIFGGCLRTEELDDGYEFHFAGGEAWALRLVGFVVFERRCCPFFDFELLFEAGGGPIRLRVRGPEGAKEIVAAMIPSQAR
jgi:hypothetical protein